MPADILCHVSPQVLLAHLVIHVLLPTLEHRPEALYAVRVDAVAHILPGAVIYRLALVRQVLVAAVLIRECAASSWPEWAWP